MYNPLPCSDANATTRPSADQTGTLSTDGLDVNREVARRPRSMIQTSDDAPPALSKAMWFSSGDNAILPYEAGGATTPSRIPCRSDHTSSVSKGAAGRMRSTPLFETEKPAAVMNRLTCSNTRDGSPRVERLPASNGCATSVVPFANNR